MKYISIPALALSVAGCAAPTVQTPPASNPKLAIVAEMGTNAAAASPNKPTRFNEYDADTVDSVTKRWDDLLNSERFRSDKTGEVVVQFRLHSSGIVSDVKITKNQVGELLGNVCEKAIKDPAPFKKWPPDMAKWVGADYREIPFTFHYR